MNVSPRKGQPERIVEQDAATGRSQVLWTPAPPISQVRHLSLSPDGKAIAFMAVSGRPGALRKGLMVLDLETGKARPLTPSLVAGRWPYLREAPAAWSPDGRLLMVEVNGEEHYEYHVCSASGGPVKKLDLGDKVPRGAPSWSPDGRRLAFATFTFRADNWVLENVIPPAQARRAGVARR